MVIQVVKELASRAEQEVLGLVGHAEIMGEEQLVRKINRSNMRGMGLSGRPLMEWMDS